MHSSQCDEPKSDPIHELPSFEILQSLFDCSIEYFP